ncbi:adenylate cyclase type 2 isoform X2 [Procambarus clarkii]|uniref:adenylate cyclase type 2 isoform X2 n=1 Tax=Procambarus clarkii TaxID=6728 RepID=UPI001E677474|nr:adenylate cyclase type 2-like isoform X2 [Procambarus clarkii]
MQPTASQCKLGGQVADDAHHTAAELPLNSSWSHLRRVFVNAEAGDLSLEEEEEERGVGGPEGVVPNGRGSLICEHYDPSPRSSEDSHNAERFEIMARNSLSSIQQRRQSTASAFIREPLTALTDDRNWSWRYLRERFRIKDLEDLFEQYQFRLHHAMLIVYLFLQLFLSCVDIIALLTTQHATEDQMIPEVTGHAATLAVCVAVLMYMYNENTFREFPRLHIVMSGLMVLTLFTTDIILTLYFHYNDVTGGDHKAVKFGNMVYVLLVVYVFLPIPRKYQTILMALFLSAGYLALGYFTISGSNNDSDSYHVLTKMCVEASVLLCVNLVGVYWSFMSEVAFRRAFLDMRGNLESKFKLDAEKEQEDGLLLSVLPKNIMQKVKSDFRNMIEQTLYHANPISKKNPFPNLYINRHEMVSILYADIVNFTPLTTKLSVGQLVEMLNDLFGKFDDAAETNACLRIKILGDCYYCVSGVPEYTKDHANNCVKVGLEMIHIIRAVREERQVNVDMRIGIHSGSVLSGLIGVRKWQFDVWSNNVTIANHMEQTGVAGRIHVTQKTRDLLSGLNYGFEPSDGRARDELLQAEGIETYLIIPKQGPMNNRKVSYAQPAFIKPRISMSVDTELTSLYEGDVARKVAKVHLPQGAGRGSILNRRRSTHTESSLTGKRRTVVTDSALANFQRIMVNSKKFMEEAIESMPVSKYDQWFQPEGIHPLLLTFSKEKWEVPLLRQADPLYKFYILAVTVIFLTIFVTQEVLMPVNQLGWVLGVVCVGVLVVVAPLVWLSTLHQRLVDPHNDLDIDTVQRHPIIEFFYASSKTIITSIGVRIGLFLLVCGSLYVCAIINLPECKTLLEAELLRSSDGTTTTTSTAELALPGNFTSLHRGSNNVPALCCDPWNFTYSCTLALLAVWTFFRMHFLLKFILYIAALAVYALFVYNFAEVYSHEQLGDVCPPLTVSSHALSTGFSHVLFVFTVFIALHMMDRQMEYIMRLDFKWKQQLEKEQKEAETTHFANKLLLQNILPLHVAELFLGRKTQIDELYHESYQHVSVLFASIPGYGDFYRENFNNEDATMCLSVLNEIISDFDMLTYNVEFLTMEKIKVVGSTYMAACGLQPGRRNSDDFTIEERDKRENVLTITKFAAAMFVKLEAINKEHMQPFQLRVGIDVGPVIAGVVGAHKPMYDIWGNTVNVASRMDYTGLEGKIHVTTEVGKILEELGWNVQCRGEILVKGKGIMITYFVDPTSDPGDPAQPSGYNNNSSSNNNNNNKPGHDPTSERRRSSQLSLNSLKGLLSSHRGSLDINTSKEEDTQSTQSSPAYRPITNGVEKPVNIYDNEFQIAAMAPRYSLDSRMAELSKAKSKINNPSSVLENHETSFDDHDTEQIAICNTSFNPPQRHSFSSFLESKADNVIADAPKLLVQHSSVVSPSSQSTRSVPVVPVHGNLITKASMTRDGANSWCSQDIMKERSQSKPLHDSLTIQNEEFDNMRF